MIRSMTGFAEKTFSGETFHVKLSVKSLNHRFFDWNIRGAQIGDLEDRLRLLAQRTLHRGRLDVFVDLTLLDRSCWTFRINEGLLDEVVSSVEKSMRGRGGKLSFSLENLFQIPHVAELKRKSFSRKEEAMIEDGFRDVLEILIKNREKEGRAIAGELRAHMRTIQSAVNRISRLAKKQPRQIRDRLLERMKELKVDAEAAEEKLLQEASYLAQRYDLNEEIERLKSHLSQVDDMLSQPQEGGLGKKLDFIAQEIFREANTINSKAQDIQIIKECLLLKNELESVRQQVQNLE
ncbi:MAG: YicC family protein [Acidobacteria bacterium]|nr:YicC family protein [Acidobacteriota bacterium]MBU4329169.1 YicC family protein [Acidobacteriota bacterium]MBU4495538.1 YicC family protein [Acidobacteriota bacterium]MCG2816609.1 YicC family protein [Candidatus Aminicenantes bacterium]